MSAPTPAQLPKPIIIKRSLSYSVPDPSSSSLSSSPTSSDATTCNVHGSSYEVRTMRSTCSLPTRPPSPLPNIKFAPLPTIEPRKRKSNVQLGVAARSRMIQQRRNTRMRNPPTWTDMDEAAPDDDDPVPMDQDPFEVFGKYVFGKGRHLWKRVSQKGTAPTPVVVGKVVQEPDSTDPERTPLATLQYPSAPHLRQGSDNDSCQSDSADHSSEGGVWEDEIGEELRLQLLKLAPAPAPAAGNEAEKKDRRVSIRGMKTMTAKSP